MILAKQRQVASQIYIIYLVIYYFILLMGIEPVLSYSNTFGLIGSAMCLPMLWIGIHAHEESQRLPWELIALGAFEYLIGETIWAYREDLLGVEIEGMTICDLFYISNCILCMFSLYIYLRQFKRIQLMSSAFDILLSVLSIGGIMYNFTVRPLIADGFDGFFMAVYYLYGPLFDIAIVSGLLLLIFGTDHHDFLTPTNLLLGCGFSVMFVLDELFLIEEIYGIKFADIINPLWSTPFVLLGLASMHSADEPSIETSSKFDKPLEYLRMLLPYFFALIIILAIGTEHHITFDMLFIWGMLMVLMLSLRQIAVMVHNKQLMEVIQINEKKLNAQNAELQKLNAKITHDSEIDFLTQLSNRRHIDQTFERLLPVGDRQENLGLILIDVDFFKRVNDTFGHQTGDEILQKVASLIRASARHSDIPGRFGGDEFILLLPGANKSVISTVSERLTELARGDSVMRKYGVSLSIGGSSMSFNRHNYNIDNLLKKADEALYYSKEHGRDQFAVR